MTVEVEPDLVRRIRQFARLKEKRTAAEAVVEDIKAQMKTMHDDLRDDMIEQGLESMPVTVKGRRLSVHVKMEMWARPKGGDKEAVIRVLKRCRLGHYVKPTFNANSLSSYVRNRLSAGDKLPPTLAAVLDVTKSYKLVAARVATKDSKSKRAARNAPAGSVVAEKTPAASDGDPF